MKEYAGKRVLMLIENNPFGQDVRVQQEVHALIESGYRVSVICPSESKWIWKHEVNSVHIYSYPAPLGGEGIISYLWEYTYSIFAMFFLSLVVWQNLGFDIIHAANPPDTAVFVAAFYKIFGKYYIFDHHDLSPEMYRERFRGPGNPFIYKALLFLEKLSCRLADHVIATNSSYKKIEIERNGIPEERITIVRNGPLLKEFHLVDPDPLLRKKGECILGYVGTMANQDGVDYLLRALHLLIKELKRCNFYCVIIGKGSALQELKDLAKQLDLQDHVWFTGFIPKADMLRYLSTADICIDPDPSNPFNDRCTMIKLMEYMTMGKPIVAFDLPEHRVTAGDSALYARPNDELDFARKIAILLDEIELRKEMGRIGRERIENELDWTYQKKHLLEVYKKIREEKYA